MTAVYVVTRFITYFGALLRGFWEHVVCRIYKIPVEDDRVFSYSELCGHIEHELTCGVAQSFMMCFVPFFMNMFLGICMLLTGSMRIFFIGDFKSYTSYMFLWIGVSLIANCAPSFEDALSFKDNLYGSKSTALKVILSPFFGVVYACAFLERYSVTFLLSIAFSLLPLAF